MNNRHYNLKAVQRAGVCIDLYRRNFNSEALALIHELDRNELIHLIDYLWKREITDNMQKHIKSHMNKIGHDAYTDGMHYIPLPLTRHAN